jgi:hypothetical protein
MLKETGQLPGDFGQKQSLLYEVTSMRISLQFGFREGRGSLIKFIETNRAKIDRAS